MLEGHRCTVLASLLTPDQWLGEVELMGPGHQTSKELMGPGYQTSKEQGELVQKLQKVVEEHWDK